MTDPFLPPMQNSPGIHQLSPYDGSSVRDIRFATLRLDEPNENERRTLTISTAVPQLQLNSNQKAKAKADLQDDVEYEIENVVQTYSVHVPYDVIVDGKSETRMRKESRTRTVPVRRRRNTDGSTEKLVKRSYTVSVPYTEQVELEDGTLMSVTRSRLETRTQFVDPDALPLTFVPNVVSNSFALEKVKCFSRSGDAISVAEVVERLSAGPQACLMINSTEQIVPFFERLLDRDAIILVEPEFE